MTEFYCYDSNGNLIEQIYQWDVDRYVRVTGIEAWENAGVFFNFASAGMRSAYSVPATDEGNGVYSAKIPNKLLMLDRPIDLFIYQVTASNENSTIGKIKFTVAPRVVPQDYVYVPTENAVLVADGLVIKNGIIYLAVGGANIGTGAQLATVDQNFPEIAAFLTTFYKDAPYIAPPESIESPEPVES